MTATAQDSTRTTLNRGWMEGCFYTPEGLRGGLYTIDVEHPDYEPSRTESVMVQVDEACNVMTRFLNLSLDPR